MPTNEHIIIALEHNNNEPGKYIFLFRGSAG